MRGRELARDPTVGGIDVGLVDRAPERDEVTELISDSIHERYEGACGTCSGPAALAREPQRACEVMQGDHRLDSLLAHLAQHVAVVPDLARIELTLGRLD